VGCPLPPIPGLRGKFYATSTRVDESYNDIIVIVGVGGWVRDKRYSGFDECFTPSTMI